jgi:hypothetical protein
MQPAPGKIAAEARQLSQQPMVGTVWMRTPQVLRHQAGGTPGRPRGKRAEGLDDLFHREIVANRGRANVWDVAFCSWMQSAQEVRSVVGEGVLGL